MLGLDRYASGSILILEHFQDLVMVLEARMRKRLVVRHLLNQKKTLRMRMLSGRGCAGNGQHSRRK